MSVLNICVNDHPTHQFDPVPIKKPSKVWYTMDIQYKTFYQCHREYIEILTNLSRIVSEWFGVTGSTIVQTSQLHLHIDWSQYTHVLVCWCLEHYRILKHTKTFTLIILIVQQQQQHYDEFS